MRQTLLLATAIAILLPLFCVAALAETGELKVERLRLLLRTESVEDRARDSVLLSARFPSEILPRELDLETAGVVVTIGPATVTSFPPVGPRAALVRLDEWHWKYKEKKSPERAGVRKLTLDFAAGRLSLRVKKVNLWAVRASGASGLRVTLTIGETTFSGTVDLHAKGKRWSYKAPRTRPPFIPPLPPGGGGGGEPPPGKLSFRVLENGAFSAIATNEYIVARDPQQYSTLWARHSPPMPPGVGAPDRAPPYVDFTKEIVVGIFLGASYSALDVRVDSVESVGGGARVRFSEIVPGPTCPVPMLVGYPFALVAVSRVEGEVAFSGSVFIQNCP